MVLVSHHYRGPLWHLLLRSNFSEQHPHQPGSPIQWKVASYFAFWAGDWEEAKKSFSAPFSAPPHSISGNKPHLFWGCLLGEPSSVFLWMCAAHLKNFRQGLSYDLYLDLDSVGPTLLLFTWCVHCMYIVCMYCSIPGAVKDSKFSVQHFVVDTWTSWTTLAPNILLWRAHTRSCVLGCSYL